MNITKILKSRRLELGISQATLAKHLGLKHKSSIYYLESGRTEWRFDQVLKTCEILELEIKILDKEK